MYRSVLFILIILFMSCAVFGDEIPPQVYTMDDVCITLIEPMAESNDSSVIKITGEGIITISIPVNRPELRDVTVEVTSKKVFQLLNRLYLIEFFQMRSDYTNSILVPWWSYWYEGSEGDTVRVNAKQISMSPKAEICCEICNYKKSVKMRREHPLALWKFWKDVRHMVYTLAHEELMDLDRIEK